MGDDHSDLVDSDDDDQQQHLTGFHWGNIDIGTGRLDREDSQRYPEQFRDNLDNSRITAIAVDITKDDVTSDGTNTASMPLSAMAQAVVTLLDVSQSPIDISNDDDEVDWD